MFLRGAGTNGVSSYTTYVGQALNTPQADAVQAHTHDTTITINSKNGASSLNANFVINSNNVGGNNQNYTGTSSSQTGRTSSVETRPVSYSVNYVIKY